ncbi:ATP-binding Cassette (ABC) Superfamily [Phytophthora infestans T30-4]|uniref:ATP-binding Cassette (ABC) Superfamily n=1 Tax=Phytophthora infestans (strain T30-4) TaxID=403677 RepID=D0NZQ6_PHYIT|nr:ATP-binding Cassette (ABC) Superfamily [Phytophthora infestans T30-4]EEY69621.1 ATP-binding Cassette (ABC) Superfamily [Phytophthora infestans T30-4]|eukprot:XP_002997182.1 ATP-binding Cassette (ABC) Superfamily [Phytophthora infestans T30-4]
MGIVYQTAIFLSVGQLSEIPSFMDAREVFYKQRSANFYRTSSFVIAYLTAAFPVIVCESVVFGSLVYWMCGFVAEAGPFLVFLLEMILSSVALSSSYVVLSILSPNLDVAQPLSTLSTVLFSVFSGFVVPMTQIPALFSWFILGESSDLVCAFSDGAGKTTLMDVIAGRKTGGSIRGEIMLNGFVATERAIRRCTGYCEQQDTHSEGSTIREALTFSALLRQDSSISMDAKRESVEECLDLLGLCLIADQVEQMKRVTIGVELAAQPSVLFLDEPTSGLDAHSAKMIMDGVRKVANTGRTVVCTIHQPSSDIFFLFDSLLVLKQGGEMVFFGNLVHSLPDQRECGQLIDYFESIPGLPGLSEGQNPATWMLQCIGNQGKHFDFYNLTRLVISMGFGVFFGLLLFRGNYTSYQGINSAVGVILMTTLSQGNISFYSVLPFTGRERAAFYRERNAQTYSVVWYFLGSTSVEIAYAFTTGLLFSAIFYPMMGFTSLSTNRLYWVSVSLFVLVETYLGQFLVFALPTLELATVVGVLLNSFFLLFSGFNPPAASIPNAYKWCCYISPHRYALSILVALVFGVCSKEQGENESSVLKEKQQIGCQILEDAPLSIGRITIKDCIEQVFNIKHDDVWIHFECLLAYVIILQTFSLLTLRFFNHQKR